MKIRKAKEQDVWELLNIYNYEVEHGVSTLDLHPRTLPEWQQWFKVHTTRIHPIYVAELEEGDTAAAAKEMQAGVIAGYASLSPYRDKEAYRSTVELSVYISPNCRRMGIAAKLMGFLLEQARQEEEIHTVVSVITSGNEASEKLHEKFGFTFCGTIPEVGMKFGVYQSIDNYSLQVEA